jgi:hypothetical protein
MAGKAPDGLACDPLGTWLPSFVSSDVSNQDRRPGRADVSNFSRPDRNPSEVAGEARPVFLTVSRLTGARNEMKAARLIWTFMTERADRADITSVEQPYAGERQVLIDQPLDEAVKDHVKRTFLGKYE